MGCETGNCPECVIRVGAMPTPINIGQFTGSDHIQTYHIFIWYTDGDRDIVYRGGPQAGGKYQSLFDAGLAQQYEAPTTEYADIDWPFSNLVTNRMEGLSRNYDYVAWVVNGSQQRHMVTIAEGPNYCGLDEVFTYETRRVGMLGRTYNAVSVDRTDNSNATIYTILKAMGLPLIKPGINAPGWGTDLHTETTVAEDIVESVQEVVEPIRRELNWFESLSPIDQVRALQRAFGGR